MRADSHYVEQLDAPPQNQVIRLLPIERIDVPATDQAAPPAPTALVESVRRHGVLQPLLVQHRKGRYRIIAGRQRLAAARAAGLETVPCLVYHVDDEEAAALAETTNQAEPVQLAVAPAPAPGLTGGSAELSRSLSRVISYFALLEPSTLPQQVLTDLARAESSRAWCLSAAIVALDSGATTRATVSVAQIARRVADICEPERKLRGITMETRVNVREATYIDADPDAMVAALAGAIISTLEEVHGAVGAAVTVVVSVEARSRVLFSILRTAMARPHAPTPFASVMTDALARIAEAHGGRVTATEQRQDFTRLMELPLAASAAM